MADPFRSRIVAAWVTLVLAASACGGDGDETSTTTTSGPPPVVERYPVASKLHVPGRVAYPQTPPVGGDHNALWQNCGFYSQAVEPERGVHSMEHGAVWVTFRPNLPKEQVDALRRLARSHAYVLVSPWSDATLPAPVVASAWGVQVKLPSATHPALGDFVNTYAGRGNAPEPGAPCTGAFGTPESG